MTSRERPKRVRFDFVRSPFFRVVHSNGAWGGITPREELSVTFFSERHSPPLQVTHTLTPQGRLGPETGREKGTGDIQRECEVEVIMSMAEAVSLHRWIGDKIDEWRKVGLSIPREDSPETS